jgi:hypothetical protein
MADRQLLSLERLRIEKVSGTFFVERPLPGRVKLDTTLEFSSGDEIDSGNPAILRIIMRIEGEQGRKKNDAKTRRKSKAGEADVVNEESVGLAFELSATLAATFHPRDNGRLTKSEVEDYLDVMQLQAYPYIREYFSYTLDRMGIRLNLPFSPVPLDELRRQQTSSVPGDRVE